MVTVSAQRVTNVPKGIFVPVQGLLGWRREQRDGWREGGMGQREGGSVGGVTQGGAQILVPMQCCSDPDCGKALALAPAKQLAQIPESPSADLGLSLGQEETFPLPHGELWHSPNLH